MRAAIFLMACGTAAWAATTEPAQPSSLTVKGTVIVARKTPAKGTAANVAVWLTPVGSTTKADASVARPRPRIVQQHKQFSPHLLVVPVGTTVEFPNLDTFFHNAFSLYEGKRFDLGLYEGGSSKAVTFGSVGVCYVFCNIHPDMSAVVVVVDTPYWAVSGPTGDFSILDVPPGRYTMAVWHERNTLQNPRDFPREITVAATSVDLGAIRFVESSQVIAPHMNKYGREYVPPPGTGYVIIKK